jgi:hypothetical protein
MSGVQVQLQIDASRNRSATPIASGSAFRAKYTLSFDQQA